MLPVDLVQRIPQLYQGASFLDHVHDLVLMVLIREAEMKIGLESKNKSFRTPIHLTIGQEAVAVGVSKWLNNSDSIFGNHRSHGHYLSKGAPLSSLFAEILGRRTGASGGKGGSMHLKSIEHGVIGTMPIVAGTIPIAVGAALAKRIPNRSDISVIFFGDGAAEEGVFHESLNLAKTLKLPILFVCENNLFSSHLHIEERQPRRNISRFASAHDILNFEVDGNSASAVSNVARNAIEFCRVSREPVFVEAHTYRLYGHVGPDRDESIGLNRLEDLPSWEKRDPILLERQRLVEAGKITESDFREILERVRTYIDDIWSGSLNQSHPVDEDLTVNVYFEGAREIR